MDAPLILATGGAGYIGSHVVVELLAAGYRVAVLDNLENSEASVLDRIAGIDVGTADFVQADVRDADALRALFDSREIAAVVHLAGRKVVGESVAQPLDYFSANVCGAVTLLEAMRAAGVGRLIFSSSANVYGTSERIPIDETAPTAPANPYGQSKLMIEQIIEALAAVEPDFRAISLRYFNPVGAHASGLIGETPRTQPTNLFPFMAQAALGRLPELPVHGGDYPTPDGTGIRDYIHVSDLACGHVAAVRRILGGSASGHQRLNLGTGRGVSVLEAVAAFAEASGREIPVRIVPRRPEDVAVSIADPARAEAALGWRATRGLAQMCADQWTFASRHEPGGPSLSAPATPR